MEMFYLTMHSTHFIYGYIGVRHMVKDHSDSEKGNLLLPQRLLFLISSKSYFICIIRITHTMAFVASVLEHWLEQANQYKTQVFLCFCGGGGGGGGEEEVVVMFGWL